MPQVPGAGLGIGRGSGAVERGGQLFVATGAHHFGKGGIHLIRQGIQTACLGGE